MKNRVFVLFFVMAGLLSCSKVTYGPEGTLQRRSQNTMTFAVEDFFFDDQQATYGFAFCIDVARQHYWDRYMPKKARGDTLLLGATFKAADQDTKYLFTKLYLEVPMKEVNEDGSFSLKVEDVYLFSRTSPLEEEERVRVPLAEASILFEQSDFEACAFSGTLRLKGTLPNEEKESFEINPVYFTMSDKWDSYVINYLFWGPEHMGFRGKNL